jgi:hypothetical protein
MIRERERKVARWVEWREHIGFIKIHRDGIIAIIITFQRVLHSKWEEKREKMSSRDLWPLW